MSLVEAIDRSHAEAEAVVLAADPEEWPRMAITGNPYVQAYAQHMLSGAPVVWPNSRWDVRYTWAPLSVAPRFPCACEETT
jgi:hypothetical protein